MIGASNCMTCEKMSETKISKLLTRRGVSASEVARKAGVAPSTVTRMAAGAIPTRATLKKIAGALGVKERSILG